jgi:hypothetical protein
VPSYEHLQSLFNGGELSPRLHGRVESDLYRRALAQCENWEPLAQGSLRMRGGTVLVGPLAGDARTRIVPWPQSDSQDLLLELVEHALKIYAPGAVAPVIDDVELILNGDFSIADGAYWSTDAPNGVGWVTDTIGYAQFTRNDKQIIKQKVTVTGPADLTMGFVEAWQDGDTTGPPPVPIQRRVRISTTEPFAGAGVAGDIFDDLARPGGSVGAPAGFPYVTVHVPAGSYWLSFEYTNPADYEDHFGQSPNAFRVGIVSLKAHATDGQFPIVAPWTADQVALVQCIPEPGGSRLFFTCEGCQPFYISKNGSNWKFGPVPFQNIGEGWGWGGPSWPAVGEIYQSRLYLAATPSQGNRIWASRVGDPFNMDTATGSGGEILASDAIDATLSTKGRIRWLQGRQALLAGTIRGEGSITAQGGAVTPLDFQFRDESAFGSAPIQSEDLGDEVVYVSRDLRKVRALSYLDAESAWHSHDITVTAEHITASGVKEVHFARDPNLTIVVVLKDGTLACCTYDRSGAVGSSWQDRAVPVAAWWRVTTQGTVLSAAVSHGPEGSLVYLAVERQNGIFLEVLLLNELAAGRGYLDAAVTLPVPAGDTPVVTGLDHLNGMTVRIILDGALEPDQVVQGGQVTLARAGTSVTVGLGYTATAKTLPTEGGNPRGTVQRAKRRWVKCVFRLNDSALPEVNGVLIAADRTPSTPMDTPEPRYTGDVVTAPPGGWDTLGQLTIVQARPYRTEILAIFGSLQWNEV